MSLATTRSRRANAGANMAKLLDKEEDAVATTEDDDFYKSTYGGFYDVSHMSGSMLDA